MKGYVRSIEKAAQQNATFRTVLYTAKNCQLVVMSLKPGEDIGEEVHQLDQLLRVEEGEGKAVLDGIQHKIKPGFAILVPAGTRHNIINSPSGPMKLYTLYAPPNHRDGVVHATKADAEVDEEHLRREDDRIAIYPTIARADTLSFRLERLASSARQ
jgi:mannose-6-phosphate isomerase-like protein (cupin superfamily)